MGFCAASPVFGFKMRFLGPFVYIIAAIAVLTVGAVVWVGVNFRQFETITVAGTTTKCKPVIGIAGASDIEPLPGSNVVYLSSFDQRGGAVRGEIIRFDLDDPLNDGSWRDRTDGTPGLFVPMGIDLYHAPLPDGRWLTRLFVVNLAGPEVLLFDVDVSGDLVLRERFTDSRLTSPNDVVSTGPRSFYVTNDTLAGRHSWKGKVDFLLGLKTGQILEYDGDSWSDIADGLAFPNGLAMSEDGKTLFLAEMRAKLLVQYDRDPKTDVLTRVREVSLNSFPDNVSIDVDGHVLVGTVPQPLSFSAYGEGLKEIAPSNVIRVMQSGIIETVFRDPGDLLSAATVGVSLGEKILIGSRAADRFLMCEKNDD